MHRSSKTEPGDRVLMSQNKLTDEMKYKPALILIPYSHLRQNPNQGSLMRVGNLLSHTHRELLQAGNTQIRPRSRKGKTNLSRGSVF